MTARIHRGLNKGVSSIIRRVETQAAMMESRERVPPSRMMLGLKERRADAAGICSTERGGFFEKTLNAAGFGAL